MRAFTYTRYGSPDNLRLTEIPTPAPAAGQALIRIHAVSINGSDREGLAGRPFYARVGGLTKPGHPILGSDIAGQVVQVGPDHKEFQPGDEVFGEIPGYRGGFAEYVCTHGRTLAHRPDWLSEIDAAALPQGGVIAWTAICKAGQVQPGQQVLINGAGGSGGTFAVQLAKRAGAEVTAVDSAGKADFLQTLGADHFSDYRTQDFTRTNQRFDLILDLIAHRSPFAVARALKPGGTYFCVGGSTRRLVQILVFSPLIRRTAGKHVRVLMVPQSRAHLLELMKLVENEEVRPVIDRVFPFEETREAMGYVVEGKAKGKVVIRF